MCFFFDGFFSRRGRRGRGGGNGKTRCNLLPDIDIQLCQKRHFVHSLHPPRLCASMPFPLLGSRARKSHVNPQGFKPRSLIANWTKLLFDLFEPMAVSMLHAHKRCLLDACSLSVAPQRSLPESQNQVLRYFLQLAHLFDESDGLVLDLRALGCPRASRNAFGRARSISRQISSP
jgi:hypothetical protein